MESGVLYVISSILKCLFPEACNRGVRQEWDVCAHWGAVLSFSLSSASQKASSPANYEQCHPSSLLYVYFSSLGWPGWPFFCRGDEGPQTNAETPPQFFQQLSSCNGITARNFEDPVLLWFYFGTELLSLLLFSFDMFLLFMLLQISENYKCTCILLIKSIKTTNSTKSGSSAIKLSYG